MKNFIFSYNLADLKFTQGNLEAFIAANKYIAQWSYAFPGTYLLKSDSDFGLLLGSLTRFLGKNLFIISEIDPVNVNGLLNPVVWSWLNDTSSQPLNALLPLFKSGSGNQQ